MFTQVWFILFSKIIILSACVEKLEDSLLMSCKEDVIGIAKLAIQNGINLEVRDENERTSKEDVIGIAKFAIQNGINLDVRDENERTAFINACESGQYDLVRFLCHHGAQIEAKDYRGRTGFSYICENGHLEIINLLISYGVNIEQKNVSGMTPLMFACLCGRTATVELLIKKGVNMEETNQYGDTGLIIAVYKGHTKTVEVLMRFGANIHHQVPDPYTTTAFLEACCKGHHDIVKLLIQHNADIHVKDKRNQTALHYICGSDYNQNMIKILPILIEEGIDLETKNIHGESAFSLMWHGARYGTPKKIEGCKCWNVEMMMILLHYGVDWRTCMERDNGCGVKLIDDMSEFFALQFCQSLKDTTKKYGFMFEFIFDTLKEFWGDESVNVEIINLILEFYCQQNNFHKVLDFVENM